MRALMPGVVAAAMVLPLGGCGPQYGAGSAYVSLEVATKVARDRVYPATVRVDARREEFVGGKKRRTGGNGSGVIFDGKGHVLTNFHVAGRADELTCILFNKERVKAKLVGGDPWTDLAVIQLDLDEVKEKGLTFEHAELGDSDTVEEGDSVLAIGSPFGLSRSISSGIISCRDRILGTGLETPGGFETGLFNTWLQTDAAINPGNSGGPLVNYHGEVVGINTRGGGNDLGFAVPINLAKEVVRQILDKGKVTRSTIGLTLQPLQDLETFFDVGKTEGAVVSSVEAEGPAAKAGVQAQDVLLEFGGEKVEGRYPEQLFDLRRRVSTTPIGEKVKVKLKRGGEVRTVELVTEELTTVRSKEENFLKWGLVGQDITDRLAQREQLPTTKGVYVTGVRRGEPAERAGVKKDDIIVRVGEVDVAGAADLKRVYAAAVKKKQEMVLLRVRRGQGVLPVLLRLDYAGEKKPEKKTPATKPEPPKPSPATKPEPPKPSPATKPGDEVK
ncbi:MAG TPA: trypsin-like peptidase domain-containing protein [Phycisphaerae bacterium]|nr:trypsin-like peptidase domain-containing protein [Phycisphaerae bacterium]